MTGLAVDDIESEVQRLRQHGVTFTHEPLANRQGIAAVLDIHVAISSRQPVAIEFAELASLIRDL